MPRSSRRSAACAGRIRRCSPAWPAGTGTRSSGRGTPRRPRGPGTARTSGSSWPRPSWSDWPRRSGACCSPSTTCTTPTTAACACSHYLARSARGQRVCIVLAHRPVPAASALEATRRSLIDRYGAAELRLGPLGRPRRRGARPPLRRRAPGRTGQAGHDAGPGRAVPGDRTRPPGCAHSRRRSRPRCRAGLGAGPPGQHVRPAAADHPRGAPAGGRGRRVVRHRRVRRPVRRARDGGLRPPRRRPCRRGSSSPRARVTGSATASSGTRSPATSRRTGAARFTATPPGAWSSWAPRPSASATISWRPERARTPCRTCCRRPRRNRPSAPTATPWRWSTRSGRTPSVTAGPGRSRCAPTCSPRSATRWPGRPTGKRSAGPARRMRGGCAPGWRTARSWRATSPRRRPPSTASTPTAAPTMPTSSWRGASTRSSPATSTRPGPRPSRRSG